MDRADQDRSTGLHGALQYFTETRHTEDSFHIPHGLKNTKNVASSGSGAVILIHDSLVSSFKG